MVKTGNDEGGATDDLHVVNSMHLIPLKTEY